MKAFPETALEFQDWFRSEQACRDYIIQEPLQKSAPDTGR
jgi:hypothetical protein